MPDETICLQTCRKAPYIYSQEKLWTVALMSIPLLLVALVIFFLYMLGHGVMPASVQSFLTPLLLLSILYILIFSALALIQPGGSIVNGIAFLFLAVIGLYGVRRLWSRIGERRHP